MISILADGVAGTVANETAVESNATPFLPGRVVRAYILPDATMDGTVPSIKIQSSVDNSTWVDVLECKKLNIAIGNVKCEKYMRAMVKTAAGTTAGVYSAWLEA